MSTNRYTYLSKDENEDHACKKPRLLSDASNSGISHNTYGVTSTKAT